MDISLINVNVDYKMTILRAYFMSVFFFFFFKDKSTTEALA